MTEQTNQEQSSQPPNATLRATQQLLAASRAELGRVIAGQSEVIGEVLVAVLTQGHALLEGVPGIAKTLIVKSVGRLLGLGFQRVQGTPDLMPADILGTTVFRPGTDTFAFHAGPVSPICCLLTKSIACRRARRQHCSNVWRSAR